MYKITLKDLFSIIFFFCMNLSITLGLSQFHSPNAGQGVELLLIFFGMAIVVLEYIFYSRIRISSAVFICLALIIGIMSFIFSGGTTILKLVTFVLIAKELDVAKMIKYNNIPLFILFMCVVLSSFVGITAASYYGEGKIAYRFGFQNPNSVPVFIFAFITGYNLICKSIKLKTILVEAAVTGVGVYYLCQSRTASLTLGVYLLALLFVFKHHGEQFFKYLLKPMQYLFVVGIILSYCAANNFSPSDSFWIEVNLLFSGRFAAWQNYLVTYGTNLFGSTIDTSLFGALDNGYLQLLIRYGISALLMYGAIFVYLSRYAYKQSDWVLLLTVVAYEVYFFNEFGPMLVNFCTPLLVVACLLMNSTKQEIEVKK